MARPLRIAAIGCGDIARRRHFPDLKALGSRAELVAIQARDPQALEAFAARFGVPRWHTDADAIMADPGIDAVLVLTPPDSHFDYAEQVIRAGKHLLVRRLLDMDAIGEVTGVECGRSYRGPTHASWFYDRSRAGGGVLIDLGIYQLTAVAALFGPALSMTASCTRHFAWRTLDDGTVVTPDVEDSALLSLVLENGIAVASTASWNGCQSHHATRARVVVFGQKGTLYFGGTNLKVHVYRPDGDYASLPAGTSASFDGYDCWRISPVDPEPPTSVVGAFVERILSGDTSTQAMAIQAPVLEIVEAAYASGGQATELATRF
jgi:predicted dehydrogenase